MPHEKRKERKGKSRQLVSLANEAPGSGVVVVCRRVGMGSCSRLLLCENDRGVRVDPSDDLGIIDVDVCNGSYLRSAGR